MPARCCRGRGRPSSTQQNPQMPSDKRAVREESAPAVLQLCPRLKTARTARPRSSPTLTSPPPAHTGAIPQPPRSRQCSPTAGHLHLSSTLSCYCFWPGGQLWAAQVCWPHQPHRAWSDPLYHMSNHVAPTSPQHPLAPTSCHVSVRAPSSHALFPPTGQSWLPLLLGSRGYPLREGAAPGQPFQTPACSLSPL